MNFSKDELERYSRQLILPEIGEAGQKKIKNAKVLLVGAGGLGSPAAIYLSALGLGTLGIMDTDKVELSNLHRQVLHTTRDIGQLKVLSAKEKISDLNPNVQIISYQERFSADNALKLVKEYDFVIDGTDNFPTRYLINDACVLSEKPFIFGGILRFEGQCSIFGLSGGPCYRCFFEEPPQADAIPSCAEAGVLGVLPGIIGLLQANEAIKLICGIGDPLKGRLLIFDALATHFREVKLKKNPNCAVCGQNPTITKIEAIDLPVACVLQPKLEGIPEVTVQELKEMMDKKSSDFVLIDVREHPEWDAGHINGAVLKPMSTLQETFHEIPKDKSVYLHCGMGGRSARAVQFLKSKGYTNVYNLKGGYKAWMEEVAAKS